MLRAISLAGAVFRQARAHLVHASLAVMLSAAPLRSEDSPALRPEEIYTRVAPSVMTLEIETRDKGICIGTAFLALREGIAVTAWHLVQDARKVSIRFSDSETSAATALVDFDEEKDIALLRVPVTRRPLQLICTNIPLVGSRAYALGAPRGFEFSLTDGLVSQVRVMEGFRQYQVSCPISPGNSGGPVLNERGEVLGIVAWSVKEAQNLNFATPAACLLDLDCARPSIEWNSKEARKHRQSASNSRSSERASWHRSPLPQDFQAFQSALRDSAGQDVTVVLFKGKDQRSFSFKLPEKVDGGTHFPVPRSLTR